jgi:hypothetical protein
MRIADHSGLGYEISSPAQTLELRVRIPLESQMCCFFSVFVSSCTDSELTTGSFPLQVVLSDICKINDFMINLFRIQQAREPSPSTKKQKKITRITLAARRLS